MGGWQKMFYVIAGFALCLGSFCSALELPAVFSSNMVLQRGKPVAVWGKAAPGSQVEVMFGDIERKTSAGIGGEWEVVLPEMQVSRTGRDLIVRNEAETKVIKNVLVGEVWLAGGQSNMDATFYNLQKDNALDEPPMPAHVDYPEIRLFTVDHSVRPKPENPSLTWEVATKETVYHFSGTAFYFAKELYDRLNIPVGIICCAWGGTYAESWISADRLLDDIHCQSILGDYAKLFGSYALQQDYENALAKFKTDSAAWKKQLALYRQTKERKDHPGAHPEEPIGNQYYRRPGGLYKSMFQTVVPYGISGIIFYQGESNAKEERGYQYRFVLKNLIENWRSDLKQGAVPFLIVQLPTIPDYGNWPDLRESQLQVFKTTEKCGLAVIVGEDGGGKLHPKDKVPVGHRLALWAMKLAYGQDDMVVSGPIYSAYQVSGNKMIVRFDSCGAGLEAAGGKLNDFEISGIDGKFHPAQATILSDNTVEVSSEQVPDPAVARYGWKNMFKPTLFNKDGLPASPFTTEAL